VAVAPALPPLSVVLPTYQRRHLVEQVVPPLLADPAAAEVVVVCDGSTDGTVELLESWAAAEPRLHVIAQANAGRQAARRAGVEAAQGEVVLLVDDDVLAAPGLATGHAAAHGDGTGRVVEGYMPVREPARRRPGMAPTFIYAAEYHLHCAAVEGDRDEVLRQLWGGNVSLPRTAALEVVAGPEFPASFGEDTHFGLESAALGLAGTFSRALRADHLHDRTTAQFLRDSEEQGAGRWWLHHLHHATLGSFDPETYLRELPGPVRALVERLVSTERSHLAAVAGPLAEALGAVHRYGAETTVARAFRRVALYRGARLAPGRAERLGRPVGQGGDPPPAREGRPAGSPRSVVDPTG
jgi:glycosyltransferase involved in cell wall biosynthesis